MSVKTEEARLARDKASYEVWEKDVAKAVKALSSGLSASNWEAIAARQQQRLFAICDLAEKLDKDQPDYRAIVGGRAPAAEKIRDLCKLPHADLVKKGLLK